MKKLPALVLKNFINGMQATFVTAPTAVERPVTLTQADANFLREMLAKVAGSLQDERKAGKMLEQRLYVASDPADESTQKMFEALNEVRNRIRANRKFEKQVNTVIRNLKR